MAHVTPNAFEYAKEIVVARATTDVEPMTATSGKAIGEYFEAIYTKLAELEIKALYPAND